MVATFIPSLYGVGTKPSNSQIRSTAAGGRAESGTGSGSLNFSTQLASSAIKLAGMTSASIAMAAFWFGVPLKYEKKSIRLMAMT